MRTLSKEILLNLDTKCWHSAFNKQGSSVIIVAGQVGAVKIYVAAVEALRKKRKDGMKLNYHQNWWYFEFEHPAPRPPFPWMLTYIFASGFFNITLFMTKLRVLVLCFPYFTDISIILTKLSTDYAPLSELKYKIVENS